MARVIALPLYRWLLRLSGPQFLHLTNEGIGVHGL